MMSFRGGSNHFRDGWVLKNNQLGKFWRPFPPPGGGCFFNPKLVVIGKWPENAPEQLRSTNHSNLPRIRVSQPATSSFFGRTQLLKSPNTEIPFMKKNPHCFTSNATPEMTNIFQETIAGIIKCYPFLRGSNLMQL